jgi:hypothetical protein
MFQSDLLPTSESMLMMEAADFAENSLNFHQTAQWRTVGVMDTAAMITDLDTESSYV